MAIHVVKPNDNLWKISQIYNVPVSQLQEVNGLQTPSMLVPGLALYIPKNEKVYRHYRIIQGDTLAKIAARFNTKINDIMLENPSVNPARLKIGDNIVIPSPLKMSLQTLGFIIPYSPKVFLSILEQLAKYLTFIAIASYSFTEEGFVYIKLADDEIVSRSNQLGILPLLMIRNLLNDEFSPDLIGTVLGNPIKRQNLIRSILNYITQKRYGGVSIDFEFIPPPRRLDFIRFLSELKTALGGLILHVNVHAKSEDLPANRIVGAYDYRAIGEVADIVAIMTIDYGYPTGPPNPVSPIWWMEQVISYASRLIPPKKIQAALPLYGYNWRISNLFTKALSCLDAQKQAIAARTTINYDSNSASPWYRNWMGREEHIVWFEDIRSFSEKYHLADRYQLLGTTFWQLSLPFPQNWHFIDRNVAVQKYFY